MRSTREVPFALNVKGVFNSSPVGRMEWKSKTYGPPSSRNIQRFVQKFNESLETSGANSHLGRRSAIYGAEIVDQNTGETVAKWEDKGIMGEYKSRPTFEVASVRREIAMAMNDMKVANHLRERVAMRFEQRREFYRPDSEHNRNVKQIEVPPELGLEIWSYENLNGDLYGIAFQGNAQKPLWHYRFRSQDQLERQVKQTVNSRSSAMTRKQERRTERSQFQHTLKEGDFLCASWGYEQTNVDFYEVVGVLPKAVVIREVESRVAKQERGADYVVPAPGKYKGSAMKKIVRQGNSVRIESYASAYLWDGKPKYETASGWGH